MPQSKHQIRELLASIGAEPRKRFGQNFMIDQNLVRLVADAGNITRDDVVIEVGPGTGTLTEELLSRARRVVAVEIDRDLASMLRERFGSDANFELVEGDALSGKHGLNERLLEVLHEKTDALDGEPCAERPSRPLRSPQNRGRDGRSTINSQGLSSQQVASETPPFDAYRKSPIKLVANLPYNIASPLVIELLLAGVELLAFTVQKEVADRLRASVDDDAYGPLSVMAQLLARVELLRTLPPQAFWPAPKVDSALVRMTREDRLGPRARPFSTFVHDIFSYRRKTMRKAMSQAGRDPLVLEKTGIDPQLRPENLKPEAFLTLYDGLGK
jgi:16S rRNA (adenine1518-N6/adenine1519-N6)-dimethyltransferase